MATTGPEPEAARCPACADRAVRVQASTVRALVGPALEDGVASETHLYCPSPLCDTVYSAGGSRFLQSDVRVRIGEKESEPPLPVCYCFDWTVGDIEREVESTGSTTIPARIREKIRQGLCRCETMNPRGICCLGAVDKAVAGLKNEDDREPLAGGHPPATPDASMAADHPLKQRMTEWFSAPPEDRPAWDIVYFFPPGVRWTESLPRPSFWTKQMGFFGDQPGDAPSGLFFRHDSKEPPVQSDWFVELRTAMKSLGAPATVPEPAPAR